MTDTTNAVPNPGSDEAIASGCTCAVVGNNHGHGYLGNPGRFIYTSCCPVHWPAGSDLGPFLAVEERAP